MKIELLQTDITQLDVDAIVNAANSSLMGGGGVDGAIHLAGGSKILEECKEIVAEQGELQAGGAVLTSAGNMPARFVIHTVGPIWHGGHNNEAKRLADCYRNSLKLAIQNKLTSIAFPNISTGIYGYPKTEAAKIAVETVKSCDSKTIEKVIFTCFDQENYELYKNLLE